MSRRRAVAGGGSDTSLPVDRTRRPPAETWLARFPLESEMLRLDDHWTWDFWFARDGSDYHLFFLKAPRSLGDPDLRHVHARIGHAVSTDLRHWELLPDALGPGEPGRWDAQATWTGNVIRHQGRWFMFYSGVSTDQHPLIQRIGLAVSEDLQTWERWGNAPVVAPDPRWYETLETGGWIEETWRDPWVFPDPDGHGFHMLLTARANHGELDARGVVGHAWSPDLLTWDVRPPLTQPGDYAHLEVPQAVTIGAYHYLVYSVYDWAHSAARRQRADAVCGTHYLIADQPVGPFRTVTDDFLIGSTPGAFYAGRLIQDPQDRWVLMLWAQFDPTGRFIGALADPIPIEQHADGRLTLARTPTLQPY